jgi:hypothetical protein
MSWGNVAMVVGAAVFIVMLLRAGRAISENPYNRLRLHEEMGEKLPKKLSFEEKQLLLDRRGISRRSTAESIVLAIIVALVPSSSFSRHMRSNQRACT